MSAKSRLLRGFAARGFGQGIRLFIRLIEIPVMLHFWGVDLYGEWLVLIAIPSYLSMGDFGFGLVTTRHMAMLVAADKKEEAVGAFQSSHLLITLTSALFAILLVAAVWASRVAGIFSFDLIGSESALVGATVLLSAKMVLKLQCSITIGGLNCIGKYPLGMFLMSFMDLVEFVGIITAVALGASVLGTAAASCVGVVVVYVAIRIVVRRKLPWLRYGWKHANVAHIKELWRPSLSAMLFPLGHAFSFEAPRLVLGALVNPAAVAIFVAHRQLVRLGTLVATLGWPIEMELTLQYRHDNFEHYARHSFRAMRLLIWLSLSAVVAALVIGPLIFPIWTAGRMGLDERLFLLLGAATFMEAIWRAILVPIAAVNRHTSVAVRYFFINAGLLFPSLLLLSKFYGVEGAAVAILIAECVMTIVMVYGSLLLLKVPLGTWLIETSPPPLFLFGELRRLLPQVAQKMSSVWGRLGAR